MASYRRDGAGPGYGLFGHRAPPFRSRRAIDDMLESPLGARREMNVGLCIALGGPAGIWGPSALASAKLAACEINAGNGIAGRACRLLTVNAADDSPDIEATLIELVASGEVDALVGMHTSAVRQRILRAVGGEVPFVYTPLYEGGETTPNVFAIGETPARQLRPAIEWLGRNEKPKRWLFVGHDYVWPHVSHRLAREYVAAAGAEVVAERYLPFGADHGEVLAELRRTRADAVLMSLVGQYAVDFNRAFGEEGLAAQALRLSCAVEENELLAIGAENTHRLYVAAGYFGALDTDANLSFKERYRSHFGERAPTLNALGQSTYEGLHFLAALLAEPPDSGGARRPRAHRSARNATYSDDGACHSPVYLARAEGHSFRVIKRL